MEAEKSYFVLLVEHVWSDYLCTNVVGESFEWMRKANVECATSASMSQESAHSATSSDERSSHESARSVTDSDDSRGIAPDDNHTVFSLDAPSSNAAHSELLTRHLLLTGRLWLL